MLISETESKGMFCFGISTPPCEVVSDACSHSGIVRFTYELEAVMEIGLEVVLRVFGGRSAAGDGLVERGGKVDRDGCDLVVLHVDATERRRDSDYVLTSGRLGTVRRLSERQEDIIRRRSFLAIVETVGREFDLGQEEFFLRCRGDLRLGFRCAHWNVGGP